MTRALICHIDFSRWHQDVKPTSVLVLSYGVESAFDWQFKLADFGINHSTSKSASEGAAMADESRGTQTYGLYPKAQHL
jgi:hypothetical protein